MAQPSKTRTPALDFRQRVQSIASNYLSTLLGSEEGAKAALRVGMAFTQAANSARKPEAFYQCSPESVGMCVAMCALTGLMPGGPSPAVWLVPKGNALNFWLSHRGISTLLLRAGYQVMPVAVSNADTVRIEFGEVVAHESLEWPDNYNDIRGVYLTVRRAATGNVLCRPWLPIQAIDKRRKRALSQDIWSAWPVEMAMKTTIHYAFGRGWLPIEGVEINLALGAEPVEMSETSPSTYAAAAPGPKAIAEQAPEEPLFSRQRTREPVTAHAADAEPPAQREARASRAQQEAPPPPEPSSCDDSDDDSAVDW